MDSAATIHRKAADLGKLVVRMTTAAGAGHPSSALSLAHIVTHLMYRQMRWDPADPFNASADRLVLSEGHAVPIIYAAYADLGGAIGCTPHGGECTGTLTVADLDGLRARDSVLDGHPNPAEGFPFFDAATGSLGMGLSVGAGLALAARRDGTQRRVYVIIGDGESREGQIWEAADFVVDQKLSRVCAIFNCNGQGQSGNVSPQQSDEHLRAKLEAFGWETVSIDGHNPHQIAQAFSHFDQNQRPLAIVVRTIKGWGVQRLQEGNWHGKPLSEAELPAAYQSLDATAAKSGAPGEPSVPGSDLLPQKPDGSRTRITRPDPHEAKWPSFSEAMESAGMGAALKKGALATRRAYGAALKVAGDVLPHVACLDGDVSNSTFTEIFAKAHSDRFFECKIAEQNMVSVAVGLSAAGYIPFANTFAKFIARAYDQVELANISRANMKLVGSHAGVTPCSDGPSQMALLDVAFFNALSAVRGDDRESPICWLFQPADAVAAYHLTRAMIELRGMCYMRTFRPDVPLLYSTDARFEPGGLHVLSPGDDLAIAAAGYMVHVGRQAVELLAKQNIRAGLVDCYSLPIQPERLLDALRSCGKRALVIEDNFGAGLGAAVAQIAARSANTRVESLICQRIPKSTRTPEEELDHCGIGPNQIADRARAMLHGG